MLTAYLRTGFLGTSGNGIAEIFGVRKQIAQDIKSEFDQNAPMTRLQLQHLEAELERLLQWKPKEKKRPIPQKKTNAQLRNEKLADIPDLFDL